MGQVIIQEDPSSNHITKNQGLRTDLLLEILQPAYGAFMGCLAGRGLFLTGVNVSQLGSSQ